MLREFKPVQAMLARFPREPIDEGMPDEERRHQELLSALGRLEYGPGR